LVDCDNIRQLKALQGSLPIQKTGNLIWICRYSLFENRCDFSIAGVRHSLMNLCDLQGKGLKAEGMTPFYFVLNTGLMGGTMQRMTASQQFRYLISEPGHANSQLAAPNYQRRVFS
jgi:hypothetical protein